MADPLMLPVKESAAIEGRVKAQLSGDLGSSTKLTQDLVQTLRSQIKDQNLQRTLQDASTEVQYARSTQQAFSVLCASVLLIFACSVLLLQL
jgi:hypothetical protein